MIEALRNDGELGSAVNRAAFVMKKSLASEFKTASYNITPEEFSILKWVSDKGALQADLVKESLKDKTTVARIVDSLVKKAFIRRRADSKDRRATRLYLTPFGRTLKDEIDPIAAQVMSQAASGISPADLEVTVRTLSAVLENLS